MIVGAHMADAELLDLSYELPIDAIAFERHAKIAEVATQVHGKET